MSRKENRSAEDILEGTIMKLLFNEPFFANLLLNLRREFTNEIPTIGVMPPSNSEGRDAITLIINPNFFKSLNQKERVDVLKHECYHVINNHFVRFRELEPKIYEEKKKSLKDMVLSQQTASLLNIAADLAINEYLPNLPKKIKMFDENGEVIKEPDFIPSTKDPNKKLKNPKAGRPIECDIFLVENLKKQIPNIKRRETLEYYYEVLKKEKNDGKGKGNEKNNNVSLDNHDLWHMGDTTEEQITEKVKEVVNNALEKISENDAGKLPSEIIEAIEKLNHVPKDWRQDLQRFVARQVETIIEPTRKKRNRRYGILYEGFKKEPEMHLAIAIDTSGSVNTEELKQFIAEIDRINKLGVKVTIIECDSKIQKVYEFDPRKEIKVSGRGGTLFSPVFEYIDKNRLDIDGLIYLTDGGCWESAKSVKRPKYPVLWAILKNYSKSFNWPWGHKTEIEVKKK